MPTQTRNGVTTGRALRLFVADRLGKKPEELDGPAYRKAVSVCGTDRHPNPDSNTFLDAMGTFGQLPGNVPRLMAIVLVYRFLMDDI